MQERADPWDARDESEHGGYSHTRNASDTAGLTSSASYNQPYAQPYSDNPTYPTDAHMQAATLTPIVGQPQYNLSAPSPPQRQYSDPYYNNTYSTGPDVTRPQEFQPHPGQSS